LQSQGVKVANQGEIQLNSVEENKLVNNQNAELTANTLVSGSLAATAGLAKSDTNPTHDLTSSVEGHVEANSKVANASTSLATGLAASAATTNLASSSKATTSDSEVSGLLNEQLENLAKSDANKATQSLVPESDSLDVSAGLALLGVGALSRDTKSQVVAESAKSITPSSGLVSSELAENADLDWIMQQMPREQQVTAELGMGAELIKSTAPVSPALAQNTDQMTKVAAPLSLGLAAGESGLLEAGPESEMLIETEFKNNNANKIEPELGRQLDTSSSTRSGLGDSSLGTNTISTAPTAAVEAKLGLVTAVTNTSNPANMTMQVPPNHPNWSSEMGEKMMWMNRQGIQQAEIHLDPPELGSLTVKVSVDSDVATVSFVAASTQVKDLLEGQVQRLREMMAQQGVELAEVDVNVSQQGSGSQQSGEDADNQFAQHDLDTDSEEVDSSLMMNEANVSRSKVDFYA
jgi:flagellar hook-length control protein FliK